MKTVMTLLSCLVFSSLISTATLAEELMAGKMAPDFTVTNMQGEKVKLSDFTGEKSVVLVFSRAHWCPYCMGQVKQLQNHYQEIQKAGAEVVVVFREERDGMEGMMKSQKTTGAQFPLLLDDNKQMTGDYSPEGYSTYIINPKGEITQVIHGTKANRAGIPAMMKALKM